MICRVGLTDPADVRERRPEAVRGQGDLRAADRRIAVRPGDHLGARRGTGSTSSPANLFSFVIMNGGQTTPTRRRWSRQLAQFPNAKVQTRSEFIDNQISALSSILNILYVLLALSVIVSLFGIVNTLVLTCSNERARSGCSEQSG